MPIVKYEMKRYHGVNIEIGKDAKGNKSYFLAWPVNPYRKKKYFSLEAAQAAVRRWEQNEKRRAKTPNLRK